MDAELYLELRKGYRRRYEPNSSPLWLSAVNLIDADADTRDSFMLVLPSPPALPHDRSKAAGGTRGFPEMERFLGKSLRSFFEKYTQNGRQIWFLAGAWRSKGFHSEAATNAIF